MDTALQALLSYQFILLCLSIAAITYVFKLTTQFFILDRPNMPGSRTSAFWTEVLLPIFPLFIGTMIGWLIKTGLYPEMVIGTAGRIFFGLVAGLLSGLVYRVVWGMIKSKIPESSIIQNIPVNLTNDEISKITDDIKISDK